MYVAIAIVAFANPADVLACLDALGRQTHTSFEVVICENGDTVAHAHMARVLPKALPGGQPVTLLHASDNPGYAGGINRCFAQCKSADAWWVLNPDTVPEPGALAAMVARLARGDVAAVGALVLLSGNERVLAGGRWRGWLARVETLRFAGPDAALPSARQIEPLLDYLSGATMLVGRRMVERVGLMREDYFLYCEEVEWCLRARRASLRFGFAPDARVVHACGTTTGSSGPVAGRSRLAIYLDERNKLNLVRDLHAARLPAATAAALFLLTLRFARRGAWRAWGHALAGWRAGIGGERGKPDWLARRRRL